MPKERAVEDRVPILWHAGLNLLELPPMNVHSPLDPIAELAGNVAVPFEQARAMPKSVYTSERFLAAELEHIFGKEWYCVGRASSLGKPASNWFSRSSAGL